MAEEREPAHISPLKATEGVTSVEIIPSESQGFRSLGIVPKKKVQENQPVRLRVGRECFPTRKAAVKITSLMVGARMSINKLRTVHNLIQTEVEVAL